MKKVTFDLDGVVIPNVEKTCELYGIDFNKITEYRIDHCKLLTEHEKRRIKSGFGSVEAFKYSGLCCGAEFLEEIARKCELYIHSLSFNDDIKEYKKMLLKGVIPSLREENINLEIYSEYTVKEIEKTDIIVEDCLENLINNYTKFDKAYLIDYLYNRNVDLSKYPKIVRVANLKHCIDRLLKEDLV